MREPTRPLASKLALVTGAASGFGRATALALAASGARVAICDLDAEHLATLQAQLGDACALARRVDVGDRAAMAALADEVHRLVPALDILVNNAGVGLQGGLLETSLDDWDWVLGVNLRGVIHGCHFFARPMLARGAGHVVNVASVLGLFATPGTLGYSTSKFAVVGLSEALRAEAEPRGVHVCTVCPGAVDTGIIARTRFGAEAAAAETRRARVQRAYARRAYGAERVAHAIVDAIERRRSLVPVTPEAWVLYYLKRAAPRLGPRVARLVERYALG